MLLVAATLAPGPTAGPGPDPAAAADIVWAYSAADEAIEHVRCVAAGPGLVLVLMLRAPDAAAAAVRADRLIDRIIRHSGALRGWRVEHCVPATLAPGPVPDPSPGS